MSASEPPGDDDDNDDNDVSDDSADSSKSAETLSSRQRSGAVLICLASLFMMTVPDGFGPLQSVYLVAAKGWSPGHAGLVLTIREVTSMAASPAVGALYDVVPQKRLLLASCMTLLSVVNVLIAFTSEFYILLLRAVAAGVLVATLRPGIAVLLLSVVGPSHFPWWATAAGVAQHTGVVLTLSFAGCVSYVYYPDVYSLFVAFSVSVLLGVVCLALIPSDVLRRQEGAGSEERSVESESQHHEKATHTTYLELLRNPTLLLWGVVNFLLHFTNAPILPLVGEVITVPGERDGMLWSTMLIVVANLASVPLTLMVKRLSTCIGWKAVSFICWGTIVPRCACIVLVLHDAGAAGNDASKAALLSTQIFDAIGVASHGLVATVVTEEIMRGTGKFGSAFGIVHGFWQAGSGLGNLFFSYVANVSFQWAFIGAGVLGGLGLLPMLPMRFESIKPGGAADSESE